MNYLESTALIAVVCNLTLTLFVLASDRRAIINRVYFLWGNAVMIWNIGVFFMSRVDNPQDALFWAKMLQFGVIFLPIGNLHLCLLLARVSIGRWLPVLYLITFGLALSLVTGHFIIGVRHVSYAYYSIAGPAFWIFLVVYSASTTGALVMLFLKQRTLSPLYRIRLRWMITAITILTVCGTNDLLPVLGLDIYPLLHFQIRPIGNIAAIFYVTMVGYSVMQHQLLDIHVTLSRFAAQLVRLLFMFLIGLTLLLIISRLAPNQFTFFSFFASVTVLLVSAIAASFFFPQFFGRGTDALERQILGDRFEYHARVQNLIQTMRAFPEPQFLLEELEHLLANTMKVRSYQIILLDETTRGFSLFHSKPPRPQTQLSDWQIDSPVFRFFQQTKAHYLSCSSAYETTHETILERGAREQLRHFDPEICLPISSGNEMVGLMLLGSKINQDLYTPHDLQLLTELVRNLGLILNQIRLRNQLQVAHEQDLLGRMSRGLAHDLNNLLTPMQTLLQLFQEANGSRDAIEELLPVATRNLNTVRTYVNEALFFSRASKLKTHPSDLDETVRDAKTLVQIAAQTKDVKIIFNGNGASMIDMDAVLVKRLICNLLSNAVDASPPDSQINIQLSLLPKTELHRDWYRLQITDQGDGISPENLKRVFTPYFTTKNTGDGKRGFGLGLAIARNIVHLHGGNLSIASKEKKGTTVQVDLPSKINSSQTQNAEQAVPA